MFPELHITMYTDNISPMFKNKSIEHIERQFFLIENLYQYLNINNLHINLNKTTCTHFPTLRFRERDPPSISINHPECSPNVEFKHLGLIFDNYFYKHHTSTRFFHNCHPNYFN